MLDGYEPAPAVPDRRRVVVVAGVLALVAAAAFGVVVADSRRQPPRTAAPAVPAATSPAPSSPVVALTPYEQAQQVLRAQAAALLRGDQQGWLAAVDPGRPRLRAQYLTLFRSLRALGVSQFRYTPFVRDANRPGAATVTVAATAGYCFSVPDCPEAGAYGWQGPPKISQAVTFTRVRGHYLISALRGTDQHDHLRPTPWEAGRLVFAQGKRVTVAAAPSQAGQLPKVVALADRAAAVNDRFAGYLGNRQRRYRIYLADDRAWRSWYGGQRGEWLVATAVPLNDMGIDVVLRMTMLHEHRLLVTTLQHELGHVVTLGGVPHGEDHTSLWLEEGIAEYIGWWPRPATASWRRSGVRATLRGAHRPKSIAAAPLAAGAGARRSDAFYGLGHFAVDCLAHRFGERRTFEFVRLRLRESRSYDDSARGAFGRPFPAVDRACVDWIRRRA